MSGDSSNSFRWLRSGGEAFPAMLAAIDAARESVRLEMYIFSDSGLGRKFREALARAALRGVRVQVLNDAVGSFGLPGNFWEPLTKVGGEFRWFNPLKFGRMLYRDHRTKDRVCRSTIWVRRAGLIQSRCWNQKYPHTVTL